MIRIAILGLSHEANSFSTCLADDAYFERMGILRGYQIEEKHKTGTTTISGYLAAAEKHDDVEIIPLVMTTLVPAGRITAGTLRTRANELVDALASSGPVDGVLTSLHGAAVSEDVLDVDGYLLRRFREVVGPDVPVGVSLDLHANISAEMCAYSDVLNAYRTNPHVDAKEVAEEVADIIIRTARGEVRPTQAYEFVPAAINILNQNTSRQPMRDIMIERENIARLPGVLSATVVEGYPYADVPEMGIGVVVVTDNDGPAAARHARDLGERVWARREDFHTVAPSATEALTIALRQPRGPVLLLDVGDNIGGGAPGDSVIMLNAARELGFPDLLAVIQDPESAAVCDQAGVGNQVSLTIGAKIDPTTGPPVRAKAQVLTVHDGRYEATEAVHAGMRLFDSGQTAAVRLESGQTVIITSKAVLPLSTAQIRVAGLDPKQFKAIVAKGVHSPLAGYLPHVTDHIFVDTPGVTSADLSRFAYRNRYRPMFPFERDATYPVGSP